MLLWISFAVLTAAVVAFVLRPLRGGDEAAVASSSADVAVYRDQLQEIESERERGLLTDDEFEGARTEIARRLIKRAEDGDAIQSPAARAPAGGQGAARFLSYGIGGAIPVIAVALYLLAGSPTLHDQPLLARKAAPVEQASIMDVIARIEDRLRAVPDDGKGWDVIAPVYLRLGRYGDAAHAYEQATRLLGESPKRLVGFGEATLMINNGVVTDAVRNVSERILKLDATRIEPRIWLVLAKEQDGDLAGAAKAYQDILESTPKDAPWRQSLTERVELINKRIASNDTSPLPPPTEAQQAAPQQQPTGPQPTGPRPTQGDVATAEQMTPEQRQAFITRMVDGLAERLKTTDGKDLDGWIRLVRAYKVLGRESDAVAALGSAKQNFAGDEKSLAALDEAAKTLGIGS